MPFKPPEARPPKVARAWRLRAVGGQATKGLYVAIAGGDSDGGSDDDDSDDDDGSDDEDVPIPALAEIFCIS